MRKDMTDDYDNMDAPEPAEKPAPRAKISGNTLDLYNEDLTRSAVQGLMDDKVDKQDGFVAGYDDEPSAVARTAPEVRRRPPRSTPAPHAPRMEREGGQPRMERDVREEPVGDRVFKEPISRPASRPAPRSQAEPLRERVRKKEDMTDMDYDRYRVKDQLTENPNQRPARGVRPAIQISEREREKKAPPFAPSNGTRREGMRKPAPNPGGNPAEVDDYRDEPTPVLKYVGIAAVVVVLVLFATLIFKINSTNAKLQEAEAQLAQLLESGDANELKIENESLKGQVSHLEEQLRAAESAQPPVEENGEETAGEGEEGDPAGGGSSAGGQEYTVVSGDTLSAISSRFYGTTQETQKIRDANGLTSDTIAVGQKLIIP